MSLCIGAPKLLQVWKTFTKTASDNEPGEIMTGKQRLSKTVAHIQRPLVRFLKTLTSLKPAAHLMDDSTA